MNTRRQLVTRNGVSFVVREAVPGDAEQLVTGHRAAIEERSDFTITQPEDATLTVERERLWIQEQAAAENSILLVAEREQTIIGWAILRGGRRLRTRHTGLLGITVARPWRDRGVGTALMETLLDWAADNPTVEKVKLGVVASNERALHLYRRLGFVEEGRQPREYKKADGSYLENVLMCRFVG
jgi:ribosomal protein S18 acetylase RimI-like enzyme